MIIVVSFIAGVMLGFEMFEDEEGSYVVVDLAIIRIVIDYANK